MMFIVPLLQLHPPFLSTLAALCWRSPSFISNFKMPTSLGDLGMYLYVCVYVCVGVHVRARMCYLHRCI